MADITPDASSWSSTASSNSPSGSTTIGTGLDDNLRAIQAGVKAQIEELSSVAGTNTITATCVGLTAYTAGLRVAFKPANTNTGATTLNLTSLGPKNVYWNSAACVGGELRQNVPVLVEYDGTQFQIIGSGSILLFKGSAPTANRIPYAVGASALLQDNSALTFDGTNLIAGNIDNTTIGVNTRAAVYSSALFVGTNSATGAAALINGSGLFAAASTITGTPAGVVVDYGAYAAATGRCIAYDFNSSAYKTLYLEGNPLRLNSNSSGEVWCNVSTTASAANAYIDNATNNRLLRSTSRAEFKADVENIDPNIVRKVVESFRGIWYRSLCAADNKDFSFYGALAEELAAVDPRLVQWAHRIDGYTEITEEVEVPVVEDVEVTVIEPRDGKAVIVKRTEKRPVIDLLPIVTEDGEAVMVDVVQDGQPVKVQALHQVQRTQIVKKTRQEPILGDLIPDGIAYDRLGVFALVGLQMMKAGTL
jgi:hypothetical protein